MLRNHCGWAWRLFVAFLLLSFYYGSTARGGPLIGMPQVRPLPPGAQPAAYPAPSNYSISGYVYDDAAANGVMTAGDLGVPGVQMVLAEYSYSALVSGAAPTVLNWYTGFTNSAGYYSFGNLNAGDVYTVLEIQPTNYTSTSNSVGSFVSSTGAALAAPTGVWGVPANGIQDAAHPDMTYLITLPPPTTTGFGPNPSGGVYSAVNYDFGEFPKQPVTPTLSLTASLALVGSNDRFLAGAGGGNLPVSATVTNTGSAGSPNLNWLISAASSGLNLSPSSAMNLSAGNSASLTGYIIGSQVSAGTQAAILSVNGSLSTTNEPLGTVTSNALTIDPVLSRGSDATSALVVTPLAFGRIMQSGTAAAALTITSTGSHQLYSDLTLNGSTASGSDSNGSYSVKNTQAVTYNGTTTINNSGATTFNVTFSNSASGLISNGLAVISGSTGLFTGETLAAGTPVLPTLNVPYSATVLQQRALSPASGGPATPVTVPLPTTTGGYLYGAAVSLPSYSVMSLYDSSHATIVNVTGGGQAVQTGSGTPQYPAGSLVGSVSATTTLINSGGTVSVPVTVLAGAFGPISGSASLSVVSAEAPSVQDTKPYPSIGVAYNISNVGYAATGGTVLSNGSVVQSLGAPLSATIPAGSTLIAAGSNPIPLSSVVGYSGTAGTNSTFLNSSTNTIASAGTVTSSNVYGTVGSECDILASTALSSGTTVTMAWRNRNSSENGLSPVPGVLPAGVDWLTSDVVDIEGVPSALTFAMQMDFEDGINSVLDHPAGRTATVAGAYLAKWNPSANGGAGAWVNATSPTVMTSGPAAQTPLNNSQLAAGSLSLAAFLQEYYYSGQYTLAQLAGSWGVDLNKSDQLGYDTSWAIVSNGGGQFAVVPEPSTCVLLGAALAGLLVYRVRRKARRKSLQALAS